MKILNPQTWFVWLNWSGGAAARPAPPLATALIVQLSQSVLRCDAYVIHYMISEAWP